MDVGFERIVNDKLGFKPVLIIKKKLKNCYSFLMGLSGSHRSSPNSFVLLKGLRTQKQKQSHTHQQ
jgi:hypothetical protein